MEEAGDAAAGEADHGLGRFDYLFPDGEADARMGMTSGVRALGLAAGPNLAAWRHGAAASVLWLAGEVLRWVAQPLALDRGEDDAPLLPEPQFDPTCRDTNVETLPIGRSEVVRLLANMAGGLPEPAHPVTDTLLVAALGTLCNDRIVEDVARRGAPLYAQLAGRGGPQRRPRPVPVEVAFAVLPLIQTETPEALVRLIATGHRLSMPTARAAFAAIDQMDGRMLKRLDRTGLGTGPDGAMAVRSEFDERAPLAWYLLREALSLGAPGRLGPLGSRLLAEALIGLNGGPPQQGATDPATLLTRLWQAAGAPKEA